MHREFQTYLFASIQSSLPENINLAKEIQTILCISRAMPTKRSAARRRYRWKKRWCSSGILMSQSIHTWKRCLPDNQATINSQPYFEVTV